jgi:ABC-type oligopeptide transport system substrate-binding subunit
MSGRTWFPLMLVFLGLAAVGWAVYGSRLPPADFTFVNESEVASVDPALITGHPEGRICWSLFEGLTRYHADTLTPIPGMAESWEDLRRSMRVYVSLA